MSSAFTFAAVSPEIRTLIEACDRRKLNTWETEFVKSIRGRRRPPSEKQLTILRRIAAGGPNYEAINAVALRALPEILERWLPGGTFLGREYLALNPKRGDRTPGSFAVNTITGAWSDFATKEKGGDVISLAAWLFNLAQPKAAQHVAAMLGLNLDEVSRNG